MYYILVNKQINYKAKMMHKKLKNRHGVQYTHGEHDQIGIGTSATVYLGVNRKTQQKVAVKTLYKPRNDPLSMKTEIKVYVALKDSPNIVQILDFFQTEQHLYLILEWCDGGDFRTLLSSYTNNRLPEEIAIKYLSEIVEGLHAIHSKGIIYRDLKPENVLLKEGQIKIGDFGSATFETRSNDYIGTPEYIAPEVYLAREDSDYDRQVDIWSLGVIFYEMLFGSTPCKSDKKQREEIFKNGCTIPKDDSISHNARDLLEKMLKLNPMERITIEQIKQHPLINTDEDYEIVKNEEEKIDKQEPEEESPVYIEKETEINKEKQEETSEIEKETPEIETEKLAQKTGEEKVEVEAKKDEEEIVLSKEEDKLEVSQKILEDKLAQIELGTGEIEKDLDLQFEIIDDADENNENDNGKEEKI